MTVSAFFLDACIFGFVGLALASRQLRTKLRPLLRRAR